MNTSLRSAQSTRSKDLEEFRQKDTTSHMIDWQDHHDHLLPFFSSIFYQSVVHITHDFFTGYILRSRRNVTKNLGMVCCLFATKHLFTGPTSQTLYRIESLCIFSRSCAQRLLYVLKSEEFFWWKEF